MMECGTLHALNAYRFAYIEEKGQGYWVLMPDENNRNFLFVDAP